MLNIAERSWGLAWRLRWWGHLPSVLLHWDLKVEQGSHCDRDNMFSLWQTIWGASFASDSGKQETGDLYPDKRVACVCDHQPESPVKSLRGVCSVLALHYSGIHCTCCTVPAQGPKKEGSQTAGEGQRARLLKPLLIQNKLCWFPLTCVCVFCPTMADSLRDEDYGILIFLSSVLIFILVGALFKSIFGRMKRHLKITVYCFFSNLLISE